MTICLKNSAETAKFFAKVLFTKTCMRDCSICNFDEIKYLSGFEQVSLRTDKSVADVENMLKENKVKYLWVNQY